MFRKVLFEDFLMQCKGILQKGCPLRGDKQYEKSVFFCYICDLQELLLVKSFSKLLLSLYEISLFPIQYIKF